MNFYKVSGQVTAFISKFVTMKLTYKQIESISIFGSEFHFRLKDKRVAKVVCIEPGTDYILWSTEDFRGRAIQKEGEHLWQKVYNENKFQEALETMISKHDASIGINWDTIDYYLNEICKI